MKILEPVYDVIIYNRSLKKIASYILRSKLFSGNPAYNLFYRKVIHARMNKFQEIPFRVMIENTNICNADCIFCPHKSMKRKNGIMDTELSKRIIDECSFLGIKYVTVYGFGEPLSDPHFFKRVEYAKSKNIARVTTNTNAMYLNLKNRQDLLSCGVDEVYISFDAATAQTLKKVRPNLDFCVVEDNVLQLLKEKATRKLKNPKVYLSFVESQINRHEVGAYMSKWKNKVDGISVSIIHNWTGNISSEQKPDKKFRRDPCRLLWTDMVISFNGDVPLCCNDFENAVILGNIKNDSIKEIWSGATLNRIREQHKSLEFDKTPICKNCEYNYHFKSPWWVGK